MAQLGGELAEKVENSIGGAGPIDDGLYLAILEGHVDVKTGIGKNDLTVWEWTFVIAPGQPFAGRKIIHKTWISDASLWRLNDTFKAFGVSTATNTDDLEGQKIRVKVFQKEHYSGELDEDGYAKMQHDVDKVLPAEGPVGVDETKKKRRAEAREAQKAAAEATGVASADSDEILF